MKKENLISKIVGKNYNNELEAVLEQKAFEENVKNTLLSILYKIETGYKDVEVVKPDTTTKDEYINNFISVIYNQCNKIKIIRMNETNTKIAPNHTFFIDKQKKEIESYPIERKLLYAIWKISKRNLIINNEYYFINYSLSNLLNVGNTIDRIEPLRDFNGYSWTTVNSEIESIEHNLIYQNLRILIGNSFLNKWIDNKEIIIDYYELFTDKLIEIYGEKDTNILIDLLIKISTLLLIKFDDKKLKIYIKDKKTINTELENMKNKQRYIENITKEKTKKKKKIKKIDKTLNDKQLLQEEYIKRNEELPLDKKIFSMRILSEIMIKEREQYYSKIEEKNELLNPKKFVEYSEELENKKRYLDILDTENVEEELKKSILQFQKIFLSCFTKKINKAETKQEIISLIYEFRYYIQLPISNNVKIYEEIQEQLKPTIIQLYNKAVELKAIQKNINNQDIIYMIWKNIFSLRAINLEELSFKIIKNKGKYEMQVFDEKIFEEKIPLNFDKDINLKENGIKVGTTQKFI